MHDEIQQNIEEVPNRFVTTVQIVALCEAVALVIALLMPITPNKTGSKGSPHSRKNVNLSIKANREHRRPTHVYGYETASG